MVVDIAKRIVKGNRLGREALRVIRPRRMEHRNKTDITSYLGRKFGLKNYLEISATATGNYYAAVDRDHFRRVERLVYRCDDDRSGGHIDGMSIDYPAPGADTTDAMRRIRDRGHIPEVVLVDSFHTYEDSLRDLQVTLDLLPKGGFMVVHDCRPTDRALCSPEYQPGAWLGLSFAAFLDFVLTQEGCDYLTVDCDYGCGVIAKGRRLSLGGAPLPAPPEPARRAWLERDRADGDATWHLFETHGKALQRLTPPEAFFTQLGAM